jgi:hypothetical protein
MITEEQYLKASIEINKAHAEDNSRQIESEENYPAEVLYSQRMVEILDMINPDSSYVLKLAAQCQHFRRWEVPRGYFPYDRRGYHQWRRAVMDYQLVKTKELLLKVGLESDDIEQIVTTLFEQGNRLNPNAQMIMDAACLVFLKWYMEPFAAKHQSEKVTDILRKTMRKMSTNGKCFISQLNLPVSALQILEEAGK